MSQIDLKFDTKNLLAFTNLILYDSCGSLISYNFDNIIIGILGVIAVLNSPALLFSEDLKIRFY
jgi:hypothetical protein